MSVLSNSEVDRGRLREDIIRNAEFGKVEQIDGHGRTVLTGTEANKKARDRFVEQLQEAGLSVEIDSVGNIVGTWVPDGVSPNKPAVATGSHLDSVRTGGIFDGVLGVYGGLEAVRTLQESSIELENPLKVACFTEEEGQRFGDGTLGSSVVAGNVVPEDVLKSSDSDGTTLQTALEQIGYLGDSKIQAENWDSWIELHIEQGKQLTETDTPVGIVTSISGHLPAQVEITGIADHAGATPMDSRADALTAASEFILDVESTTNEISDGSDTAVGTVGSMSVSPNVSNVIPGHAELDIDIRDVDEDVMLQIESRVKASLALIESRRGVKTSFERSLFSSPTELSNLVRELLQEITDEMAINSKLLHSGAFHDTRNIAKQTDAGMIFAPSREGISHSPGEWTDWDDCAQATNVLAQTLGTLAS